jgi:hypothetical protein
VGLDSVEMLELDRALDALALVDKEKVETAELTNISTAVARDLKFARGWLFRRIGAHLGRHPKKP